MIRIKKPEEIKILREGGKILAYVLGEVVSQVKPGKNTLDLNNLTEELIAKSGGQPSFKGFKGYPSACCISINEGLVHGIPKSGIEIKNGDIVSVDIGLKYKGLFTDMARTVSVGNVSKQAKKLIKVTKRALDIGISQAKSGHTLGDIGQAIQEYVESTGFSVVRALVGHGVGNEVHEEPRVPNFGQAGIGLKLKPGLVLALEPMVNVGKPEVITKNDGWTVVTADGQLCAHFEHTVAITDDGADILTI